MINFKMPRRWYFVAIPILVIVVAICIYLTVSHRVPSFKSKGSGIIVQPQGKLTAIPAEMVFRFQKRYPGIEGLVIGKDSISSYITIKPELAATGKWAADDIFELRFLTEPKPDQKYDVTISRVPVVSGVVMITPQTYSFITPPFELLSASIRTMRRDQAVLGLEFTYEPVMDKIGSYISVTDGAGRAMKIWNLRRNKTKPTQVLLTLPALKPPAVYKVIIKSGLACARGLKLAVGLEQIVPACPPIGAIRYRDHKIEESDYGYTLSVNFASTDDRTLEINEENLERFVRITPELPCRITALSGTVYIFGDFIPEKKYKIVLKAGITSKKGGILPDDYTLEVKIPRSKERLQFVYRGRYLGRMGEWNLPLKASGVKKLWVTVTYLPSDNVLFWHLRDAGNAYNIPALGERVIAQQEVPLDKGSRSNFVWINLKEYLKSSDKGVYLIEASAETQGHARLNDRIAVVISDLSLVLKWHNKNIYAWCFNSATLQPEPGVEIEVRSAKNFVAGTGTTNSDGYCFISSAKEEREPYVVFARKGDDWTYVHVPTVRLPLEAYDIGGEDHQIPYLAYLYPERDLYRPGDAVRFGVIVRNNGDYRGAAIPVKVKVRDPEGKDFIMLSGMTDENGFVEFSFPTAPSSPTGKYLLDVVSGDRTIYSSGVFVEAFVPERMNVAIGYPDRIGIDKPFDISIKADFLFGAPAAGETYSGKIKATEVPFTAPGYGNYSFGQHRFRGEKPPTWEEDLSGGTLDSKGQAAVRIEIDTSVAFNGPVKLEGIISVTEGGSGRVTTRTLARTVHAKPYYIGIKPTVTRIVPSQPVVIKGVLFKPTGEVYSGRANLYFRIYRLAYYYSYQEGDEGGEYYYDYNSWSARDKKIPVTPQNFLDVKDGKFTCSFTPQSSYYDYLVEVVDEDHQTVAEAVISGWGWGQTEQQQVESPEVVQLRLDKSEYDDGELVRVEAQLPFEGNILWSIELDTIYASEWREAKGELATWSFRTPRGVSSVYISALLVRSGGNYLVQRGLGIQRVKIRPSDKKLALSVEAPEKMKPGSELAITVKGRGSYKATISVVDEGILQITDFQTPDPYGQLLRNLGLTLNSAESFGWIIRKFLDRTGGDAGAREKEFPQARFARIVSSWSGLRASDNDGQIRYSIKVPEYNGKLRVMVAGASPVSFGSAQAEVVVKSDVVVAPTIPRFMYTTDEFTFPVTLLNTTALKRKVSLSLKLTNCSQTDPVKSDIVLLPQEKQVVWVPCRAGTEPGELAIEITSQSQGERYHDIFQIPVYPNTPYITEAQYTTVPVKQPFDLKKYFDDWYPRAHRAELILSTVLGLTRLNHARYVVQYPYGCIEQSSTSTMVLLRLQPLWQMIAPAVSKERYTDMVNSGIHRLMSMQTASGGFSYWPGDPNPCAWGSGYATFVLMEAKAAGFTVPAGVISNALDYLDGLGEKPGMVNYVLARGKRLQKSPEAIDRIITLAKKEQCGLQDMLFTAGTAFESGRTTEAKAILGLALKQKADKSRRYSGDFYSHMQYRGMQLFFVEHINPGISEEIKLVTELADDLSDRRSYWYSTQDLAWNMLALGLYAERSAKQQDITVDLRLDGKAAKPQFVHGIWSWRLENPGKAGTVRLETNSNRDLYLCIENTGFSKNKTAFVPSADGISVDREIMNYGGSQISSISQGELVVILVSASGQGYYDNCAIEVPIPAGLEIENSRLGRGDLPAWAKEDQLWEPAYVDIRDDRVMIFGRVEARRPRYYYILARAVTPGKYFLPPVDAMVMYEPQYNAHTSAGTFDVKRR